MLRYFQVMQLLRKAIHSTLVIIMENLVRTLCKYCIQQLYFYSRLGFVAFNGTWNQNITSDLANNLNYDSTLYEDITAYRYSYRVQQTIATTGNLTVPKLTFILWSGM